AVAGAAGAGGDVEQLGRAEGLEGAGGGQGGGSGEGHEQNQAAGPEDEAFHLSSLGSGGVRRTAGSMGHLPSSPLRRAPPRGPGGPSRGTPAHRPSPRNGRTGSGRSRYRAWRAAGRPRPPRR